MGRLLDFNKTHGVDFATYSIEFISFPTMIPKSA
jgi:hypothetical protein